MTTAKITKRFVDSLKPKERLYTIYDTELKGFGVRVMPSGIASYIVEYRPDGGGRNISKKRMMVGRVGELTPDEARSLARDRLADVRKGIDPLVERHTKRREMKLSDLISQWEADNPPGKRTGKPMTEPTRTYTLSRLKRHAAPILGSKRVSEVTVDDISDLMRRIAKGETAFEGKSEKKRGRIKVRGGNGAARKVASDLSIVFNYAIEKKIVLSNPVSAARKPKPGKRYDFLSLEDIKAMAKALTELENDGFNPSGIRILRLILLTGARPTEIEGLRWLEVDFEGRCLRLAESKTGYSSRPLSLAAIELLKTAPRVTNQPFVFPATRGKGHFCGSKKIWNEARKRAGLPDKVRYHARHAMASHALSEGIDVASVAALMGHKGPRTTLAVYAHVVSDHAARAADKMGEKINIFMSENSRASGD